MDCAVNCRVDVDLCQRKRYLCLAKIVEVSDCPSFACCSPLLPIYSLRGRGILPLLNFLSPRIEALAPSMTQLLQHFQGLQLFDGKLPQQCEVRLWIGAFLVREAILICPTNLDQSEQTIYCNTIGNGIVSPV